MEGRCLRSWVALLVLSVVATAEIKVENVLPTHAGSNEGMVFQDGLLWVNLKRPQTIPRGMTNPLEIVQLGNRYYVAALRPQGQTVLGEVELPHSADYLYAFGPKKVLVVGKRFIDQGGWAHSYSIVSYDARSRKLRLEKTYRFPVANQIRQFAGTPQKLYFSEDRRVITPSGWGHTTVNKRTIYGPNEMLLLGNVLFVIEDRNIGRGNIARIELTTGDVTWMFPEDKEADSTLKGLTYLPHLDRLAFVGIDKEVLVLLDPKTTAITRQLRINGRPRTLALYGHCLVVAHQYAQKVSFLDTTKENLPTVAEVSTSSESKEMGPNRLAVDPVEKAVYVRSSARMHASVDKITPDETLLKRCFE